MLPAETPKLPKWPFLLADAVLFGLAWLIADQSTDPFTGQPLVWIVVCVALGAIAFAWPFVADYQRKCDEALDERQRGLDAIARTVASSAEQISIAANGLHELTEIAQRNLRAAGELGPGLEAKVAALQADLGAASDAERAGLRKELATLRGTESARLETAAKQLARTAGEIGSAEAALQLQLSAAKELCGRAAELTAALRAATTALETASATVPPPPTATPAATDVEPASRRGRKTPPPADAGESPSSPEPEPVASDAPVSAAPVVSDSVSFAEPPAAPVAAIPPEPAPVTTETTAAPAAPPENAEIPAPPPPRKRAPRKPRSEPASEPASGASPETPDRGADLILESPAAPPPAVAPAESRPVAGELPEPPPEEPEEPARSVEQSRSSDGATRLLVTAYIGIGNRLFIRGEGPGLAWDKGVPLQFVSIGKWRWETSDATGPVKYKLYKNDSIECTSLGAQQVESGQQQEVAAAF